MSKRFFDTCLWGLLSLIFLLGMMTAGALLADVRNVVARAAHTAQPVAAVPASSPLPSASSAPTLTPTASLTATPTPTPTSTPTPTQTPSATPTPVPTRTPVPPPSDTPVAVDVVDAADTPAHPTLAPVWAEEGMPTAVPQLELPPDTVNILVLGSDIRPGWNNWRTDSIQIVSIQRAVPAVTLLSIPRDLYVYIPGYGMDRINTADMRGERDQGPGGGQALLQQVLLYNLGIPVDHSVRTDFDGLIAIVDTLGGVDVPVHCQVEDYWPYPDENGEYPWHVVAPGYQHFDGEQALWYSRSRKTTSAFSRERRQQQVLQAIWRGMRDQGMLLRTPDLWQAAQPYVQTDLALPDIVGLATLGWQLQAQDVRLRNIGPGQVDYWTTPQGGSVLLPHWPEIGETVAEAFAPVPTSRAANPLGWVEIWNGSGVPGYDLLVADRLTRLGFVVAVAAPDRSDYAQTQVVVFRLSDKGTGLPTIQQELGIPEAQVIYQPEVSRYALRLIIGTDYQPCNPDYR